MHRMATVAHIAIRDPSVPTGVARIILQLIILTFGGETDPAKQSVSVEMHC